MTNNLDPDDPTETEKRTASICCPLVCSFSDDLVRRCPWSCAPLIVRDGEVS